MNSYMYICIYRIHNTIFIYSSRGRKLLFMTLSSYLCIYIYIYLYTYISVYVHIYPYIPKYIHIYMCLKIYI